jgi:hypothetical protein
MKEKPILFSRVMAEYELQLPASAEQIISLIPIFYSSSPISLT